MLVQIYEMKGKQLLMIGFHMICSINACDHTNFTRDHILRFCYIYVEFL